MIVLWGFAAASMLAWIVLLVGRGGFWRPTPRLESTDSRTDSAPSVVAVVPARNEAEVLPVTLATVLAQTYEGPFRVVLVDDRSDDGTAATARGVAETTPNLDRLSILSGEPLPEGWAGKLWSMQQGLTHACATEQGRPSYLWFTDADIEHDSWVLSSLVDLAEGDGFDLVSVMAKLRADTFCDRLLIPAFVYFFAKLYPFRFVNSSRHRTAAAAGGCVLVRRAALERAGGLEAIRSALIDDCALARRIKQAGRIWLGFSRGVRSVRGYGRLSEVWRMVARSAYTQLGHSALVLIGTIAGMLLLYALPPLACLGGAIAAGFDVSGTLPVVLLGGSAWGLMSASFVPILRHHDVGARIAPLLPVAGVLYTAMTISSAWCHARGYGGAWKGRTYSR